MARRRCMLTYKSHGLLLRTGSRTPARSDRCPALERVLILEQRARGLGMGRHATRQAGRRQGEAATGQGKRQGSTDTVAASLAAGPTVSLAFEQPLCLCR